MLQCMVALLTLASLVCMMGFSCRLAIGDARVALPAAVAAQALPTSRKPWATPCTLQVTCLGSVWTVFDSLTTCTATEVCCLCMCSLLLLVAYTGRVIACQLQLSVVTHTLCNSSQTSDGIMSSPEQHVFAHPPLNLSSF